MVNANKVFTTPSHNAEHCDQAVVHPLNDKWLKQNSFNTSAPVDQSINFQAREHSWFLLKGTLKPVLEQFGPGVGYAIACGFAKIEF